MKLCLPTDIHTCLKNVITMMNPFLHMPTIWAICLDTKKSWYQKGNRDGKQCIHTLSCIMQFCIQLYTWSEDVFLNTWNYQPSESDCWTRNWLLSRLSCESRVSNADCIPFKPLLSATCTLMPPCSKLHFGFVVFPRHGMINFIYGVQSIGGNA